MTTYSYRLCLNDSEINWIKGLDSSVYIEDVLAGALAAKMTKSGGLMAAESYTVSFDDREIIKLGKALRIMIEKCEWEIDRNPRAPFLTHLKHAKALNARLNKDTVQTSGNNFSKM